ncbi:queuosine precursor transporter [Hoeflea sp. YIM 152468]|uniref:queuosine precursor transporter n=1 Tax=Hoeflea sp. YIM 152468 TaxID=3031759 RepID=UPI0023DA94AB|nr:queuosine precursor transporter [Hoeflea sp. YIM 152468]MDF1608067.1 queuosine precursor transporter [Hoeflea sp. YIM 152468]
MRVLPSVLPFMAVMAAVVVASNYLVQFPVVYVLGSLNLADLLTWGAFTYPVAFLVTDLANRRFGAGTARQVVFCGFVVAVILSIWLATPRIAVASGSAFLVAQLLDVSVFDRLRDRVWWLPPLVSTLIGSSLDTMIFFGLAFSDAAGVIGPGDAFASEWAPLFGLFATEAPRWLSWALGDLAVKMIVGLSMLLPYGVLLPVLAPRHRA